MREKCVTTVLGKAAVIGFYALLVGYVCIVVLPRVLPQVDFKRKFIKPECPKAWRDPDNPDNSSICFVYPENLMEVKLPPFLKDYKNPCWKEPKDKGFNVPIRCLPYFYLIGAPKCGTTDLHTRLLKHPQMSDRVKKEIHWFTRKRFVSVKPFYEQLPSLENYTYILRLAAEDAYFITDDNGYHNKIIGDSSVSTLWDNSFAFRFERYTNYSWPMYTIAQNIHHLNPNTKFVSIIRDPIERLYSDYLYFAHGRINTKEHFHTLVQEVIVSLQTCLTNDTIRDCTGSWGANQEVRILVGLYHIYFKEFYDFFPREQILVMKLEDFTMNVTYYMHKVFEHLELDPVSDELMDEICDTDTAANTRRKEDLKLGGMLPETRKLLQDFYRPHNEKLAKLLGEEFNYNNYYEE